MQSWYWIGFGTCLGFGFGVGCALAVMYSIYLGGYRAAVRDFQLDPAPKRLTRALERLARSSSRNAIG